MTVTLEILSGPLDGHVFQVKSTTDIGREGRVKIEVDRFISRNHAILELTGRQVFLEDRKSTNGSFVEDERLHGKAELSNGQIFRLGRTWLQVRW